ncbi:MAG: HD domain-containing protein [Candidatus Paceibacterota bacterium]|jgi:hypothetical protein
MENLINDRNITEKFFRVRENIQKIKFIIANSDIDIGIIRKAAILAKINPFHNFGHEVGSAEQGIRIAIAEGRPREEINLIAMTLLFHDADHRGIVQLYDEMHAFELANLVLLPTDTKIAGSDHNKVMTGMRDLILGTIFPGSRGKHSDPIVRIIQDADLAHLGLGPVYWIWASMGLIEEFNRNRSTPLSPEEFIRVEQEKFVGFLAKLNCNGRVFLSPGAKKIFSNPLKDVVRVKKWSLEVINYSYEVRREDVTIKEFTNKIISFSKSHKK